MIREDLGRPVSPTTSKRLLLCGVLAVAVLALAQHARRAEIDATPERRISSELSSIGMDAFFNGLRFQEKLITALASN